jgi:hypothetical protein
VGAINQRRGNWPKWPKSRTVGVGLFDWLGALYDFRLIPQIVGIVVIFTTYAAVAVTAVASIEIASFLIWREDRTG